MSQRNGTTPGTCGLGERPKRSPASRARDTYSFRFGQSEARGQSYICTCLNGRSVLACILARRDAMSLSLSPQKKKKKQNTTGQSPAVLFLFYLFCCPFLSDCPPMTILASRLSLEAAAVIGRVYDPSTRNGPALLCRDPSPLRTLPF